MLGRARDCLHRNAQVDRARDGLWAAINCGSNAEGLPVGIQIIGPRNGDALTLAVAQAIDEQFSGFRAPPLK